jgi:hypothetical protein
MAVPPNSDLPRICASPEFTNLVERVKRELQVSIAPNFKILGASNGAAMTAAAEAPAEYSFKFRCQRSNSDFLITAREMLEQFLLNHNVHVYPSPTSHSHKRGDSFAEAFPHFDSKVLSTAKTRGHGKPFFQRVCMWWRFTYSCLGRIYGLGPIRSRRRSEAQTRQLISGRQGLVQFPGIYIQP